MKANMATRNTGNLALNECTAFVLHKSQQTNLPDVLSKIIDYTEHKLIRFAESTKDPQQKLALMALISDYRTGKVAVAFRKGSPVYMKVTKES